MATDRAFGRESAPRDSAPAWLKSANRWLQLTLVEDDPGTFDPQFWVNLMERTAANAVCLSAGGYMAFYPTAVPNHYRSRYLGDDDPFGYLVAQARRLGMAVMARIDAHAVHSDVARAHPEWLARTVDGAPRAHWSTPGAWVTCMHSSYSTEFLPQVIEEVVRRYDVDAIFANRWAGHGVSYGDDARASFHAFSGLDLPTTDMQPDDEAWRAYRSWRQRELGAIVALWDDTVRAIRPTARFIPNLDADTVNELDRTTVDTRSPIFLIDHQGREGLQTPLAAGRDAKRCRGIIRDRPVGLITSVGPESSVFRWKDSVNSPDEIRTWAADGIVHGAFPWFTKFNGKVPDPRWVEPVTDVLELHRRIAPTLTSLDTVREILLVDSGDELAEASLDGEPGAANFGGFYHALTESRIPFELVSAGALTTDALRGCRVLVLPGALRLGHDHCATIRDFVANGGSVVAAFDSSLVDEDGATLPDLRLGDVFRVRLREFNTSMIKNGYLEVDSTSPLTEQLWPAKRIIGGTFRLLTDPMPGVSTPLHFIPEYPDLPMEEVYPREPAREPALIAYQHPAGGRVAYFPFNIGSVFWQAQLPDHLGLINRAVRWCLRDRPVAEVTGPGLVDTAVYHGARATAVGVVNLTNPMAMRGIIRHTLPLGGQEIVLRTPSSSTRVTAARSLVRDTDLDTQFRDGAVRISLPEIDVMDLVLVEWA